MAKITYELRIVDGKTEVVQPLSSGQGMGFYALAVQTGQGMVKATKNSELVAHVRRQAAKSRTFKIARLVDGEVTHQYAGSYGNLSEFISDPSTARELSVLKAPANGRGRQQAVIADAI